MKKRYKTFTDRNHWNQVKDRLSFLSTHDMTDVYAYLQTDMLGLEKAMIQKNRDIYGDNTVTKGKENPITKRLLDSFINPFTAILLVLACVSIITDIIMTDSSNRTYTTVIIIIAMVMLSGILRFIQETKSGNAAAKLSDMIHTTTCVERKNSGKTEIELDEVVVGDIVHVAAGDMIPADMRILFAKDLFISQSALTGESEPVEKEATTISQMCSITDTINLAFMGSNVISGTAKGIVGAVGNDTVLGQMAKDLSGKPIQTSFEKGVNAVSWVLIRFMIIMVPIVFLMNGLTKHDWMDALLFALSIAVGLTPEMLPMIVTTCLAKGAVAMSKQKVIIKNLNSIQNLGSIDILCTDKTGTLTQDKVVLEYHLNVLGETDPRVLRHAFLNSYYQTGLKNLLDLAVLTRTRMEEQTNEELANLENIYQKVDEIPFDFERRIMSVVVKDQSGKTQLISKGAVEEMIHICSYADIHGIIQPLDQQLKNQVLKEVDRLNAEGMRVVALAQKTNPSKVGVFSTKDESDMVLLGYLAFLDPPKESAGKAIATLHEHGVEVKVLTGDNEKVSQSICRQLNLPYHHILSGADIEKMNDAELKKQVLQITVFAKLSPVQKARIVRVLRDLNHVVGYMGDGINDAAAMKQADVGISVDTAVDIAKESADVILLEKDLTVLENGIVEGRKTYANMIKYIKMTASSNFGNMFSVLIAGAFLPFLPMASIHLILLNLIYDVSCSSIPWDNVDPEFLQIPRSWEADSITRFMIWMGPTSSVFDIITYLVLYFLICPAVVGAPFHQLSDPISILRFIAVFQAGWFVESMWSQTLVIHMIRTPKIPFLQSHASKPVTFITLAGMFVLTLIPFTPLGNALNLAPLPLVYFGWLLLIIAGYLILETIIKKLYIKKYHELL